MEGLCLVSRIAPPGPAAERSVQFSEGGFSKKVPEVGPSVVFALLILVICLALGIDLFSTGPFRGTEQQLTGCFMIMDKPAFLLPS